MIGKNGRRLGDDPWQLVGAVVDPDLIELRSAVLVAAFGIRIPMRGCWIDPSHPWNGNYLAFSFDHGETWSHVVRLTSGVMTTHYMSIAEMPTANELYVAFDLGVWDGPTRGTYGQIIKVLTPKVSD